VNIEIAGPNITGRLSKNLARRHLAKVKCGSRPDPETLQLLNPEQYDYGNEDPCESAGISAELLIFS
jgi:hypothetical protein